MGAVFAGAAALPGGCWRGLGARGSWQPSSVALNPPHLRQLTWASCLPAPRRHRHRAHPQRAPRGAAGQRPRRLHRESRVGVRGAGRVAPVCCFKGPMAFLFAVAIMGHALGLSVSHPWPPRRYPSPPYPPPQTKVMEYLQLGGATDQRELGRQMARMHLAEPTVRPTTRGLRKPGGGLQPCGLHRVIFVVRTGLPVAATTHQAQICSLRSSPHSLQTGPQRPGRQVWLCSGQHHRRHAAAQRMDGRLGARGVGVDGRHARLISAPLSGISAPCAQAACMHWAPSPVAHTPFHVHRRSSFTASAG